MLVPTGRAHVVTIAGLVNQRHRAPWFSQQHPLLPAALEVGVVPGGIGLDRPFDVAKLDLVTAGAGGHVEGKVHLEHAGPFGPVDVDAELHRPTVGIQGDGLDEAGLTGVALHAHLGAQQAFGDAQISDPVHRIAAVTVLLLQLPSIEAVGIVWVQDEPVGALSRQQEFAVRYQVNNRVHQPVASVNTHVDESVRHPDRVATSLHMHRVLGVNHGIGQRFRGHSWHLHEYGSVTDSEDLAPVRLGRINHTHPRSLAATRLQ